MKENPYASPETAAESVAAGQAKRRADRASEVFHNVFRGLMAFFSLGFGPIFIVPSFSEMFEEFGIELPLVTQYVVQLSNFAVRFSYVFLLLTFSMFAAIELGLFWLPKSLFKTLINACYWLMLVLAIGVLCFSLWVVLESITTSLGTI